MKAYVSIDFEGLPGISSVSMLMPRSPQYSRGVDIVTRIARVFGVELVARGFDRVVIADSHGTMANINYVDMPEKVTLIQGYPRPLSMITGLDNTYSALFLVGYHTGAGTLHGFLDHTYSGRVFYKILLGSESVSEYLLNTLVAGYYGVPLALVAGDSHLGEQVRRYTPWAVFIELKKGITRYTAEYDSLVEILERIKHGIHDAVERIKRKEVKTLKIEPLPPIKIMLRDTIYADAAQTLPKVERIDAYTLEIKSSKPPEILEIIEAIALIGYGISALRDKLV